MAARKQHPLLNRIIAIGIAASAALVTDVSLSPKADASGSVWDRVAACESGGRWSVNTGNGYYGGIQFSASTWRQYGGGRFASRADRASRSAQISVARRVLAAQGPGAWPSCGRRAGLTRASGTAYQVVSVSRSRARVALHPRQYGPGRLWVDGVLGPRTIGATQRWVHATQNGHLTQATVRALQRRLHTSADGVIGPLTVHALQVRIGARITAARHLDRATVQALQSYLNRH